MTLTEEQLDALLRSLYIEHNDFQKNFTLLRDHMSQEQAHVYSLRLSTADQSKLSDAGNRKLETALSEIKEAIIENMKRDAAQGPKININLVGDRSNRAAQDVDLRFASPEDRLRKKIDIAGSDRDELKKAIREVLDEKSAEQYADVLSSAHKNRQPFGKEENVREEIVQDIVSRMSGWNRPSQSIDESGKTEKEIELIQKQEELADKERENLDMEMFLKKQSAKEPRASPTPGLDAIDSAARASTLGSPSPSGAGAAAFGAAAASKIANGGISLSIIIGLLLDLVDGFGGIFGAVLPGVSDFVIGGILTAILLVYALIRGVFLRVFIPIIIIQLVDALVGSIPAIGDIIDVGIIANTVCMGIIDRAVERKNAEGRRDPGPDWNIFTNKDGSPSYVAAAFFTMAIASAVYGAWDGNWMYFLLSIVVFLILMVSETFRQEFLSLQGLFLILSLIVHLVFMATILQSGYSTSLLILAFICYLALALFYLLAVYFNNPGAFRHEMNTAFVATVVTILFYSLRLIFDFVGVGGTSIQYFASFIALALPMWPLFMFERMRKIHPSGFSGKFFVLYVVLLVLIGFVFLINGLLTLAVTLPTFTGSNDAKGEVKGFGDLIGKSLEGVMKKFNLIKGDIQNPGERFTGQIDANQEKPQGITQSATPQEKDVSTTSPVIVNVNVKGESFIGESVYVTPSCFMDRKDPPPATWEPAQMELIYGLTSSFTCVVGGNGVELPRGAAQIKTAIQFPFETWAYTRYTFVDVEFARNIASKGDDIYAVLGINEEAESISTDAPVIIRMGGTPQLIPLDLDKSPIVPLGKKVGLTLDGAWGSGRLLKVHSLEMKVPQPFSLKQSSCTRPVTFVGPDPDEPLLTRYIFENKEDDILQTYTTITCDLEIEEANRDEVKSLLFGASDNTLQRSFIATAKYEYVIEEEVQVRVR